MHTQIFLLTSLLTLSRAWVPNAGAAPLRQNPWDDPTPRNLELPIPTPTLSSDEAPLDATPSSISYVPTMTTVPYPTSSPSSPAEVPLPLHAQLLRWIKRQGGAVSNPQAAQPVQVTQVSPITTLTLQSMGKQINVPYTQTFSVVPDQWSTPVAGEIGLGTIQGTIGVPKSKRAEPMEVMAEPTKTPTMRWQDEPDEETATALETRSRRRGRMNRG
jgi:hypothetical protein